MRVEPHTSRNGTTITVTLPLQFRRHGGRKQVVTRDGYPEVVRARSEIDNTVVKALARAHRWQRMLESGAYISIAELAAAEKINPSYLARVMRLTCLAPDIVESILDGQQNPQRVTLARLMKPFPPEWDRQKIGV